MPQADFLAIVHELEISIVELTKLLENLTDSSFVQIPTGPLGGRTSSIGGHVRHSTDFLVAFFKGIKVGRVDYSLRNRGSLVETDRSVAISVLREVEQELLKICRFHDGESEILVVDLVSPELQNVSARSTVCREAIFLLSHMVHHQAMIAIMVRALDGVIAEDFGYAASTIQFRNLQPNQ